MSSEAEPVTNQTRKFPDKSDFQLLLPGFTPVADVGLRPFLRWAGGKTRLLRFILPYVPSQCVNYHEPFLGGGAMFFALRHRSQNKCYLTDLNDELVNTWLMARDRPTELFTALNEYIGKNTEEEYYIVRSTIPEGDIARAARFIYLNQTAWNSLWRVNRWGVFNVPWGDRPFRGIDTDELQAVSRVLTDTVIREIDFREALKVPQSGDFVYMDPPYLPVSDTSKFAGYTEKRFRAADLAELALACRSLTERGVSWILSNRDTEMVRDLFAHAQVVSLTTRRSVAAQNRRDVQPADSPEAIIIGGLGK